MKKLKKVSKIIFISLSIIFAVTILSCVGYYFAITYGVSLNKEKIEDAKTNNSLIIFDKNKNKITPSSEAYIEINNLSADTKNAFISAEDKRFYNHNGIDYIRVAGALVSNIKSKNFSEGASTISQQLIKNTLLSSEKTISRKLKEFKLARALEKEYSKDEILEMYLNNIYFGNGAYGIENAAIHYFGKSASKLTLSESALFAGTINAPSYYDIQNNFEKALERRNLILTLMFDNGKISEEKMNQAKSEEIVLNITKTTNNNYIYNEILEEASKILNKTENELKNSDIEIQTDTDLSLTETINNNIKSNYPEINSYNCATMIIDNNSNLITSVTGNKKTLNSKKQPGSTIKPILIYAPAFEKNIVSPATKLLDEEININGYQPQNADGKNHGFVSVREALKNSYNIPAVKLLNEVGIIDAQEFAKKLNIEFDNSDNNLAIALGGFTNGLSLKQLADAYSSFANNGEFSESSYISQITKNNKVLYKKNNTKTKVMNSSTAYLITDILKDCSKTGTAKRLKDFSFDVASKTGTVGKSNSNKNTDAFCISYTTNHTIITYIGDKNLPSSINGSTYPTLINKSILSNLYKSEKPKNFTKPNTVTTKNIDLIDYKNNIVSETNNTEISLEEIFSNTFLPKPTDRTPNLNLEVFNFENRKPILSFFTSKNYTYNIIRKEKNKEEIISSLNTDEISKITKFEDISAKNNEIYEYFVEICDKFSDKKYKTKSVKLKTY